MLDFINSFFGSEYEAQTTKSLIESNTCPNCWGHQEFDNKFKELAADKTKANLTMTEKKTFVEQFVETHLDGIRLASDGDKMRCPTCQTGYKIIHSTT